MGMLIACVYLQFMPANFYHSIDTQEVHHLFIYLRSKMGGNHITDEVLSVIERKLPPETQRRVEEFRETSRYRTMRGLDKELREALLLMLKLRCHCKLFNQYRVN